MINIIYSLYITESFLDTGEEGIIEKRVPWCFREDNAECSDNIRAHANRIHRSMLLQNVVFTLFTVWCFTLAYGMGILYTKLPTCLAICQFTWWQRFFFSFKYLYQTISDITPCLPSWCVLFGLQCSDFWIRAYCKFVLPMISGFTTAKREGAEACKIDRRRGS